MYKRQREQKAREGKWNGGFAPYGYKLENGNLVIAEDEVEVIRVIYDRYIHTNAVSYTHLRSEAPANHGGCFVLSRLL